MSKATNGADESPMPDPPAPGLPAPNTKPDKLLKAGDLNTKLVFTNPLHHAKKEQNRE